MTHFRKSRSAPLALTGLLLLTSPVVARESGGSLLGWVQDDRGVPVAGALVSLFGKGAGTRGLIAFTDSAGRFVLSSLPAGSYTVRALGPGYRPAAARRVKILPNVASVFTVSLLPGDPFTRKEQEARAREMEWLLRHKTRSVLEDQRPVVTTASTSGQTRDLFGRITPWASAVGGSVDFLANAASFGVGSMSNPVVSELVPHNLSVVRLGGQFGAGHWSLGGILAGGGTVDNETTRWKMAAAFVVRPLQGHEIQADAGYGNVFSQPLSPSGDSWLDQRGVGALSLRENWESGPVSTSVGTRYTYVGSLTKTSYADPMAVIALRGSDSTTFRVEALSRTVIPGGNPLAISSLGFGPNVTIAVVDPGLRAERVARYEVAVSRELGASSVGVHAFYEDVQDPLLNSFSASSGELRIANIEALAARGFGFTYSHRFGSLFRGTVAYTFGRSWRDANLIALIEGDPVAFTAADFHDIVTRFETTIERSGTRVVACYRLNALDSGVESVAPLFSSRFDFQLRQGLPFLSWLTRAEWELLLAYRNMFYEPDEGATLDEVAVLNPPRRVVGGLSVRF